MLSPLFGGVAAIFIVAAALVHIASPFLLLAGLYYVFIPARRKKVAEEKNRELFLSTLQKKRWHSFGLWHQRHHRTHRLPEPACAHIDRYGRHHYIG